MNSWLYTDNIIRFIIDEVRRQGYDPESPNGIDRIGCMARAWAKACEWFAEGIARPDVEHVLALGKYIEPTKNTSYAFRKCGVRVGNHVAPPPDDVHRLMLDWASDVHRGDISGMTDGPWKTIFADCAYVAFQNIHPFVDGNGRTGKIIHNWINGTLHDPVLVRDYFGGGNP